MDIAQCKQCQKIFQGKQGTLCSSCRAEELKRFSEAKAFLKHHPNATIYHVAEHAEVTLDTVQEWIRSGRLRMFQNPNLCLPCERCETPIATGRYCLDCQKRFESEFSKPFDKAESAGRGYHSR